MSDFVDIPARRWPWTPLDAAPERVALPLVARAKIGLSGWAFLWVGLLSLACVPLLVIALLTGIANSVYLVAGLTSMLLLLPSLPMFATLLADRFGRDRKLIIRMDGLIDQRASAPLVPWQDIDHAKLSFDRTGIAAVTLRLRRPIAARHNPFRIGTFLHKWSRAPAELHVPLAFMSVNRRRLGIVIMMLVKNNGGTVDYNTPAGFGAELL